jgi:pimeloyl-ACP methyl ester carboxylesterase
MRFAKWFVGIGIGLVVLAVSIGAAYQWLFEHRDLAATPPPGNLVDVGGHRLHLWCIGSGDPAVVYDAGLGGTSLAFADAKLLIADFTRVCTYDRAGMGFSDPGPLPRTSRRIASELSALLERSGMPLPVVLVGASFGGYNVRMLASEYSDQVAGLVLLDASHEDQGARYAAAGLPSQIPPYARLIPMAASLGVMRFLGLTLGDDPENAPAEIRDYARATAYRSSRFRTMASELASTAESASQVRESRRQLDIPLVVLSAGQQRGGVRGEINAELQRDQATLSTRSCHVIACEAGHGIAGDMPTLVAAAVRAVVRVARDPSVGLDCDNRL